MTGLACCQGRNLLLETLSCGGEGREKQAEEPCCVANPKPDARKAQRAEIEVTVGPRRSKYRTALEGEGLNKMR